MAYPTLSPSEMVVSHINETIMQEVMATHDLDSKDFQTNFFFNYVKNILHFITTGGKAIPEDEKCSEESDEEILEDKRFDGEESDEVKPNNEEPKDIELSSQIKRLSFEMALKCWDNVDQHSTVIYFLKMLSIYSWKTKLFMMLAAFSINIGEFSIVNCHKGILGRKLSTLKGSTTPLPPSRIQESIAHFIKSILDLTKCIVELAESSSSYNSSLIIPVSCYWIVTSIVTCASYFARFPSANSKWIIAEGTQLSKLMVKVKHLISNCHTILEKKREQESYNALCCAFLEEKNPIPSTNLENLKLLFNAHKKKPIYDGHTNKMVELRLLKNKSFLLLVSSSIDIDLLLLYIFNSLMWVTRLRVLWIPILDDGALWRTEDTKKQCRNLANQCGLLLMRDLQKSVAPGLVRFFKEKFFPIFQMGGEPIVVSLDHYGRIAHRNAMHMIVMRGLDVLIKNSTTEASSPGDSIIPSLQNVLKEMTLVVRDFVPDIDTKISDFVGEITSKINDWALAIIHQHKEDPIYSNDVWKEVSWCTKLLSPNQSGEFSKLVDKNKYTFIMGGNNIKWVKKFANKVLHVHPQLEIGMRYIGTNIEVASMISRDNICEAMHNPLATVVFWEWLQSMFLSRTQFLNETHRDEESDEIVKGLKRLLAYETEESRVEGWALLSKGNKIIVCDLSDKMLMVMNEYEKWKENAIAKGFDEAFKDHHQMLASASTSHHHPYCALKYPSNFNTIPTNVKCPQCCRNMHKFVTFTCGRSHV